MEEDIDVSRLRFAFCAASVKAEACLSQGVPTTTALQRFKQADVHDERMLSAQNSALLAIVALLDSLDAYTKGRDWWLLRNTIKFNKRLHAMLFYQRLHELWRVMEAFTSGPCWKLLAALRAALNREGTTEKRVVTPEFLRHVGELSGDLHLALEYIKVSSSRHILEAAHLVDRCWQGGQPRPCSWCLPRSAKSVFRDVCVFCDAVCLCCVLCDA
jgi:hypothetical protein